MTQKPEYVDLLNDIRLQEAGAAVYLRAWGEKTTDPELKDWLSMVTAREVSHGEIFGRRINELGFETEGSEDQDYAPRLELLGSDRSDAEKIQELMAEVENPPKPTLEERYKAALVDESVDSLTRSLLSWWTDVEADTVGRMVPIFDRVKAGG
jgi:hypothetical protein